MTAPNEPLLPFGLRSARIYALNASLTPAAVDTSPYEGVQVKGSVAFELTVPEPRKITGLGEDGVTAVAYLPPTESVSGNLNVEADDPALTALATGNLIRTLGEANLALVASGNQGFEPNVGMVLQQAMRGLTSGRQFWRTYILPSAMLVMRDGGMNAEKSQTVFNIAPNVVSAHLWGEAFTTLIEGAESSQLVKLWTNSPLRLTSFVGNNTEDEFLFPVNAPSASSFATSTKVFVDGVLQSGGVTIASTKITFTVAPATGKRIDVLRELA